VSDGHAKATERAFTQQAETFADARSNRVLTSESEWVFARLAVHDRDLVLDLAAGTGLGSRTLAPRVRAVLALDATPAMLEVGRAEAEREGLANIVFQRGDAAALPFLDGSFTIVVCRYALHHFLDRDAVMAEIARVLLPYGRLGLADLVADEHADQADAQNAIERMRDPSHVCALSASGLQALIVHHGLEATAAETREIRRPLGPWLEQSATPPGARTEIERRLLAEIDGGQQTGLQPQREPDGALSFVHTLTSVFALKPGQ
jgi:ubiquinone/menaquinone biosynthesis C-methylase UbiE